MSRHARSVYDRQLYLALAVRTVSYVSAVVITVIVTSAPFRHPAADRLPDLLVYRGSVDGLAYADTLYAFHRSNGDPFTYPPVAGILLFPLHLVPLTVEQVIWTLGTVVAVWLIVRLVTRAASVSLQPHVTALAVAACLGTSPLRSNLRFGQISIFLVLAILADLLIDEPPWPRGFLIGLSAAVKLTPAVFIPYLWLTGRRRAAAVASTIAVAATAGSWLLLPADSHYFWFQGIESTRRVGNISLGGNRSLYGMLLRSSVHGAASTVLLIALLVFLTVLGFWRAQRAAKDGGELRGAAIIGCLGVVVSPVSWTHHAVWLLLTPTVLMLHRWPMRKGPASVVGLSAVTLLFTVGRHEYFAGPIGFILREALGLMAILTVVALPIRPARPMAEKHKMRTPTTAGPDSAGKHSNWRFGRRDVTAGDEPARSGPPVFSPQSSPPEETS